MALRTQDIVLISFTMFLACMGTYTYCWLIINIMVYGDNWQQRLEYW